MGPLRVGAEAVADRLRFLNSAFAIRRSKFPWPDRRRRQKLLNDLRSRFFRPARRLQPGEYKPRISTGRTRKYVWVD